MPIRAQGWISPALGFCTEQTTARGAGWHTGFTMEPLSPALNAPRCYRCHCTAFNEHASGLGEINGFLYLLLEQNSPLCSQRKQGIRAWGH